MNTNKHTARIAGVLFLILAVCAGIDWSYIHSIYVSGDAITTFNNIQTSGWIFRLNFVSNLIGQIAFLFTAYFLYKLFRFVNRDCARLMALLVFVSVPIAILNMLFEFAPIILLGGKYTSIFQTAQINGLVLFFLDLYIHGVYIAGVFWGLWLLPLGYLVFKSGFAPKIIGVFLEIAGLGYVVNSILSFLMPNYTLGISSYTFIGEVMFIFWLLFNKTWNKNVEVDL
jgi:hypothetical protein